MNNGINPMHGAPAMPVLPDEPGSPIHQAPIAPVMPAAPRKPTYSAARLALRDRIEQRAPRNDILTTPSATLSQTPGHDGTLSALPHELLTNVARRLAGPAEVQNFRLTSKASRLRSLEAIEQLVLEDPADLDAMINRYPSVEKITLVGDVFSSRVLERIKQDLPRINHIVVLHAPTERNAALAGVQHLPKQGTLDPKVANLAASLPAERTVQRTRTLADLAALFPEPVGHPSHVRIEVPPPPAPPPPSRARRTLNF